MFANLYVNRFDRVNAAKKEQRNAEEINDTKTKLGDAVKAGAEARALAVRLQEEQAPRIITPEQRTQFIQFVKQGARGKVQVITLAGSHEAFAYAEILKGMLVSSGCEVTKEMPTFIPIDPMTGIRLKIKNQSLPPPHAGNIQKAFERIGINVPASVEASGDPLPEDTVAIYVAGKK